MLTTVRTGLPLTPVQVPERTCSAKAYILSNSCWTSASTSCPSTCSGGVVPLGRRSAVCSTARSSVTLMRSPANIARIRPGRSTCWPRSVSAARTSSVTRFLDRSTYRSPTVWLNFSARCGSAANQARRSGSNASAWLCKVCQAAVVVESIGVLTLGSFGELIPVLTVLPCALGGEQQQAPLARAAADLFPASSGELLRTWWAYGGLHVPRR